jgi:fibronectin type 3 domain-containing protein
MKRLLCNVRLLVLLHVLMYSAQVAASTSPNSFSDQESLAAPTMVPLFDEQVFQTDISLDIYNSNNDSQTEIYRSTAEDGAYQLIHTEGAGPHEFRYVDENVKPRTRFYYKARAVKDGQYSPFSDVLFASSMSKFYPPQIHASVQPDRTVEIDFQDVSYQDNNYTIFRVNEDGSNELIITQELVLSDSGQARSFTDAPDPGGTYIYGVNAEVRDEGFPTYTWVSSDTVYVAAYDELLPPEFNSPNESKCGRAVTFGVSNENPGGFTEIYRSLSRDAGFEHHYTLSPGETGYVDDALKPRTTYYYTLRTERDGQTSQFSDTLGLTSGSEFFNPILDADDQPDGSISMTFTDRSFAEGSYEIYKTYRKSGEEIATELFKELILPDSGSVTTLRDTAVASSGQFIYRVNAILTCEGHPVLYEVAGDTVIIFPQEELTPPALGIYGPPENFVCGNEIDLTYSNDNADGYTEIYRSRSADSGFELIYTETSLSGGVYLDKNLISKKTYYYKARAVRDGESSPFSPVVSSEAGYGFYPPVITATPLDDTHIEVKVEDRSYLDLSYELYGWNSQEEMTTIGSYFVLSDSGSVYTIIDSLVVRGQPYSYHVNAYLNCDGQPYVGEFVSDTVRTGEFVLIPPSFDFSPDPGNEECGDDITFGYSNPNPDSYTEIWRANAENGEFELINAVGSGDGKYTDMDLGSRKTYYYKLRATTEFESSAFSETVSLQTDALWFNPDLNLRVLPNNTVEAKLTDKSYLDYSYEIYAVEAGTTDQTFSDGVFAPDSGGVYTFIDASVMPGKTYIYYVNAQLVMSCEGGGTRTNIAIDTISVPNGPAVYSFTVVDPDTEQDVMELTEGMSLGASFKFNIRANANNQTSSVEFHINGKRYGENQEPYALFGDHGGNYNRGKMKPGQYTLTATAYSGNLQRGTKGTTLTVHFTVYDDEQQQRIRTESEPLVEVNVFPNPVIKDATIEVSGYDESAQVSVINASGNWVRRASELANRDGILTKEMSLEGLPAGVYYIIVKTKDNTYSKRIVLK